MAEAQPMADAQFGLLAAGGSITIRFARKYPSIANRYLLAMLRSAPQGLLPDGTLHKRTIQCPSNRSCGLPRTPPATDEDVTTLARDAPPIHAGGGRQSLAHPTLLLIARWFFATRSGYANFGNRSHNRSGRHAMRYCRQIEQAASDTGLGLLYAAATRSRLTILGESQGKLDAAVAMAEDRLTRLTTGR